MSQSASVHSEGVRWSYAVGASNAAIPLESADFFAWRRFLLRLFGTTVGKNAHVYPTARIYLPWMLSIGPEAIIGEWALIYHLGVRCDR